MKPAKQTRKGPSPRLIDVDAANFDTLPCCGIKSQDHRGRQEKRCWLEAHAESGVRARMLVTASGEACGYIESMPGECAWRGVDAAGYLFIQCIWIPAKYKGKGYGRLLVKACLDEAKKEGRRGVAVMVREGPWMADRRLFVANGFQAVDTAPPDCELLARKFNNRVPDPGFRGNWDEKVKQYGEGLTLVRAKQCPHMTKFVTEIGETAEKQYHTKLHVMDLQSAREAQNAPTPYAVFSLIYDGKLLADHPISRTRFRNIMNKLGK